MRVEIGEKRPRLQCAPVKVERTTRFYSAVTEPQFDVPEAAQAHACEAEVPRVPLHTDDGDPGFGHQFGGRSQIRSGFENKRRCNGRHDCVKNGPPSCLPVEGPSPSHAAFRKAKVIDRTDCRFAEQPSREIF